MPAAQTLRQHKHAPKPSSTALTIPHEVRRDRGRHPQPPGLAELRGGREPRASEDDYVRCYHAGARREEDWCRGQHRSHGWRRSRGSRRTSRSVYVDGSAQDDGGARRGIGNYIRYAVMLMGVTALQTLNGGPTYL